ncbi:ATP-binding protein [Streptomyces sp. A475]|uniref:ATP-binding protein n=1 Tax=Streptomyces sp. A475 TaxID=3131976 RepID=UPI0030C91945
MAVAEHVSPWGTLKQHLVPVAVGPKSVTEARAAVEKWLVKAGLPRGSAFLDTVLLAVSELVTNVVRHAPHSLVTDIWIALGGGDLVVGVADADPTLPDLSDAAVGPGLAIVSELVADHEGALSAHPVDEDHQAKVMVARFRIPS